MSETVDIVTRLKAEIQGGNQAVDQFNKMQRSAAEAKASAADISTSFEELPDYLRGITQSLGQIGRTENMRDVRELIKSTSTPEFQQLVKNASLLQRERQGTMTEVDRKHLDAVKEETRQLSDQYKIIVQTIRAQSTEAMRAVAPALEEGAIARLGRTGVARTAVGIKGIAGAQDALDEIEKSINQAAAPAETGGMMAAAGMTISKIIPWLAGGWLASKVMGFAMQGYRGVASDIPGLMQLALYNPQGSTTNPLAFSGQTSYYRYLLQTQGSYSFMTPAERAQIETLRQHYIAGAEMPSMAPALQFTYRQAVQSPNFRIPFTGITFGGTTTTYQDRTVTGPPGLPTPSPWDVATAYGQTLGIGREQAMGLYQTVGANLGANYSRFNDVLPVRLMGFLAGLSWKRYGNMNLAPDLMQTVQSMSGFYKQQYGGTDITEMERNIAAFTSMGQLFNGPGGETAMQSFYQTNAGKLQSPFGILAALRVTGGNMDPWALTKTVFDKNAGTQFKIQSEELRFMEAFLGKSLARTAFFNENQGIYRTPGNLDERGSYIVNGRRRTMSLWEALEAGAEPDSAFSAVTEATQRRAFQRAAAGPGASTLMQSVQNKLMIDQKLKETMETSFQTMQEAIGKILSILNGA